MGVSFFTFVILFAAGVAGVFNCFLAFNSSYFRITFFRVIISGNGLAFFRFFYIGAGKSAFIFSEFSKKWVKFISASISIYIFVFSFPSVPFFFILCGSIDLISFSSFVFSISSFSDIFFAFIYAGFYPYLSLYTLFFTFRIKVFCFLMGRICLPFFRFGANLHV